jgi:hypothetical protein
MSTKNIISKIKFSQVTATPASLLVGELAYSTASNSFFIGDSTGTPIKIGGSADVTKLAGIQAGAQVNSVVSVNSRTGAVVITSTDVGLNNVTNESKSTMFNNPTFTGTVTLPATGSGNLEAATKAYVDSVATGLVIKDAVVVATTAAGTLATSFANGSVVDGVTLVTGNRILIKNQASGAENGIYTVNVSGAPTRAIDLNSSPETKPGVIMYVSGGSTQMGTQWVLTTTNATLGTTALTFVQFGGGQVYSAGTGLTLTGSVFAIDGTVLTTASNLNASNLTSGTVALARLHANVVVDGDTLDAGSF